MKTIFLTFDYELFFGTDSGSLENSILKPTDLILDTLKEYNAPATFYIDTIYIEKLLDYNLLNEYELVKLQIQRMIKEGHRAELHLHPHWYDAKYNPETKRWNFPTYEHYRLHSYDEKDIEIIFDKSVEILYNIIHEIDNTYRLHSYRAGGWCIQPFDKIKPSLEKHEISVDSSVAYGLKSVSSTHYFDFTNTPYMDKYLFDTDVTITSRAGKFLEIPSSVFSFHIVEKILNKILLNLTNNKIYGDGTGMILNNKNNILDKLKSTYGMVSLERSSKFLFVYFLNKINFNNIVCISHPKFFSNESFEILKLINKMYKIKLLMDMK